MKLSENFSLAELTTSDCAARNGIDNTPPAAKIENLKRLAATLEQVRDVLGFPIHINSGYRSGALNKAIGGKPNSQHCQGLAADLTCAQIGTADEVCATIAGSGIDFDQLIFEFGAWVHISIGKNNRRQILTINQHGTFSGIRL